MNSNDSNDSMITLNELSLKLSQIDETESKDNHQIDNNIVNSKLESIDNDGMILSPSFNTTSSSSSSSKKSSNRSGSVFKSPRKVSTRSSKSSSKSKNGSSANSTKSKSNSAPPIIPAIGVLYSTNSEKSASVEHARKMSDHLKKTQIYVHSDVESDADCLDDKVTITDINHNADYDDDNVNNNNINHIENDENNDNDDDDEVIEEIHNPNTSDVDYGAKKKSAIVEKPIFKRTTKNSLSSRSDLGGNETSRSSTFSKGQDHPNVYKRRNSNNYANASSAPYQQQNSLIYKMRGSTSATITNPSVRLTTNQQNSNVSSTLGNNNIPNTGGAHQTAYARNLLNSVPMEQSSIFYMAGSQTPDLQLPNIKMPSLYSQSSFGSSPGVSIQQQQQQLNQQQLQSDYHTLQQQHHPILGQQHPILGQHNQQHPIHPILGQHNQAPVWAIPTLGKNQRKRHQIPQSQISINHSNITNRNQQQNYMMNCNENGGGGAGAGADGGDGDNNDSGDIRGDNLTPQLNNQRSHSDIDDFNYLAQQILSNMNLMFQSIEDPFKGLIRPFLKIFCKQFSKYARETLNEEILGSKDDPME